jgi:hypothetical protein
MKGLFRVGTVLQCPAVGGHMVDGHRLGLRVLQHDIGMRPGALCP